MGRTYPDELKAAVIAEVMAGQETLAAIARRHGIPDRTIKGWRDAWLRSEGAKAAL
ncbi:MAG: transposase, partial [Anaerolineae bacterium]